MSDVVIQLTRSEAMVLLEWLSKFSDKDPSEFSHPAELVALWAVEGKLEQSIDVIFHPEYGRMLQQAKEELAARFGRDKPRA